MTKLLAKIFISIALSILIGIFVGQLNKQTIYYKNVNGHLVETIDKWSEAETITTHENIKKFSGLYISKTRLKRNIEKKIFNNEIAIQYGLVSLCVLIIGFMMPYIFKKGN